MVHIDRITFVGTKRSETIKISVNDQMVPKTIEETVIFDPWGSAKGKKLVNDIYKLSP